MLRDGPSLNSLHTFMQNASVKRRCAELYGSMWLARGALESEMGMGGKLATLKYMEKMRKVAVGLEQGWKP